MINHGFEDNVWLAKAVIAYAPPRLVKTAVMDLISAYQDGTVESAFDAIDRVVQISVTGQYRPSELNIRESLDGVRGLMEEDLTEEEEKQVEEWKNLLDGIMTRDEDEGEDDAREG